MKKRNVPVHLYPFTGNQKTVAKDMTGVRFGEIVAVRKGCMPYWWCRCDHGHELLRDMRSVRGSTKRGIRVLCQHTECAVRRAKERAATRATTSTATEAT